MPRTAKIDCDGELYSRIAGAIQNGVTGKEVIYSDTLVDLIRRHCPEVYAMASDAGYVLVPSDAKEDLTKCPPEIWFDVVLKALLN